VSLQNSYHSDQIIEKINCILFSGCQDSQTSAASGTIQPLYESPTSLYESWVEGTTFEEMIRACPFFINSSPNRQVQMSCSVNATYVLFNLYAVRNHLNCFGT
jgi:hypothetical protein